MGVEFVLKNAKSYRDWLHDSVNVPNAIEPYTSKWLRS